MSSMTNAIKPGNPGISHIEATPDGITFKALNNEGAPLPTRLLGYSSVIRQLEQGEFDTALHDGLFVVAEICTASVNGWLSLSSEQMVIVWRWLVACLFICEERDKNGEVNVEDEDSGTDRAVFYVGEYGAIDIYPATERFSLATHIEGLAIEKYGVEEGLSLAIQMYQDMTEVNPDGGQLRLSQMGRGWLEMLHDGYIEIINTEGVPAAPMAH
ncbi:hypothetical protein [Serratia sp. UGAL515B_01]|uniref:hypothetical protein n=1 Tax=Serratia sp. UGAL515B_01 TaxID=2986763 RepID=UPI002952B86A|nr:hypothetical protein [Serratia sp. UGAL515B_01]WON77024.1 hypothetical protein OK023_17945 [Serratia sp. UGAL515B_01]